MCKFFTLSSSFSIFSKKKSGNQDIFILCFSTKTTTQSHLTFDAHLLGAEYDQVVVVVLALDLFGLVVLDEAHELVLLAQPLLLEVHDAQLQVVDLLVQVLLLQLVRSDLNALNVSTTIFNLFTNSFMHSSTKRNTTYAGFLDHLLDLLVVHVDLVLLVLDDEHSLTYLGLTLRYDAVAVGYLSLEHVDVALHHLVERLRLHALQARLGYLVLQAGQRALQFAQAIVLLLAQLVRVLGRFVRCQLGLQLGVDLVLELHLLVVQALDLALMLQQCRVLLAFFLSI